MRYFFAILFTMTLMGCLGGIPSPAPVATSDADNPDTEVADGFSDPDPDSSELPDLGPTPDLGPDPNPDSTIDRGPDAQQDMLASDADNPDMEVDTFVEPDVEIDMLPERDMQMVDAQPDAERDMDNPDMVPDLGPEPDMGIVVILDMEVDAQIDAEVDATADLGPDAQMDADLPDMEPDANGIGIDDLGPDMGGFVILDMETDAEVDAEVDAFVEPDMAPPCETGIYLTIASQGAGGQLGAGVASVTSTTYELYGTDTDNRLVGELQIVNNPDGDFTAPQPTGALEAVRVRCQEPGGSNRYAVVCDLPLDGGMALCQLDPDHECYSANGGPIHIQLQVNPHPDGSGHRARIGINPELIRICDEQDNPTWTIQ